ncbi:DUF3634 family protein [Vibrio amylolyticus]|uniref:DUF3634 family protein n=1 Tax=Vibrio TaxID=662 RepID=UPI000C847C61|nr:DUF3634 family protein [Vibrio sp. 10N.261.55.A7]PMJ91979.1 hypothetical protein BCU12_08440 [Vibrio sp. 10N.261.55.A7]
MLYVVLVAVILVFWLVAVDRPVLKVTFIAGKISKVKGHFPAKFRNNVEEIASIVPFDGSFKVYQQRTGTKLKFSDAVPKKVQQRIRNVFPHQGFKNTSSNKRA